MAGTLNVTKDTQVAKLAKGTTQVSLQKGTVDIALDAATGVAFLLDGAQVVTISGPSADRPLELGQMSGAVPIHQRKPVKRLELTNVAVRKVTGADGIHLVDGTHILTGVLVEAVTRGNTTNHADGLSIMGLTTGCRLNVALHGARGMVLGPQNGQPDPKTGSEAATVANAHLDMQWLDCDIRGTFLDLFCAPGVVFQGGHIDELQIQRVQGAKGGIAPEGTGPTDGTCHAAYRDLEVPLLQLGAGPKDTGKNAAGIMGWGNDLDLMFDRDRCGGCTVGKLVGSDVKFEKDIRAILGRKLDPDEPPPAPPVDPVAELRDQLAQATSRAEDAEQQLAAARSWVASVPPSLT
jgi:hypothetical protein